MKKILLFISLILFGSISLVAQYPATNNKLKLGSQTTGDGLIYRGSGPPNYTPTTAQNAWLYLDVDRGYFYAYRGGQWKLEIPGDLNTIYPLVINKTAAIIKKGTVVMVDPTQVMEGDIIRVVPAVGDGTYPSQLIMGIVKEDLAIDGTGYVTWFGEIREIVESDIVQTGITLAVGDILYLSATQPGKVTNVEPTAPNLRVIVALLERRPSVNNLTILVRPNLNSNLSQINDVNTSGISTGQLLKYNTSTKVWSPADDNTIYNSNGSLSAARTVTMNNNALTFDGSVSDVRVTSSGEIESVSTAGASALTPTQIISSINDGFSILGSTGIGEHSVYFQDGSNLAAMRINASGGLGFRTTTNFSTTDNVTISSSGSVGIGNTSPSRKLHVTGTARITDLTTDNPTRLVGADADGDLSGVTLGNGLAFDGTTIKKQEAMIIACSDETTNLTNTDNPKVTFRAPFAMTITGLRANVNTAPTGSNISVDIKQNNTTILTSNKLVINAGEKTSIAAGTTQPGIQTSSITDDAEITIDILFVGSTVPGKGLKVTIYYTR